MKYLKKVTAAALSLTMMTAGMSSIPAKAYDDCDVNHDGTVDISDVVFLSLFLAGAVNVSDYETFDVNHSQTVDQADVQCISAKIALMTYSCTYYSRDTNSYSAFPSYSGCITDDYNSESGTNATRKYMRYSYLTNSPMTNYTLTAPSFSSIPNQNPDELTRAMIGDDDRDPSVNPENTGLVRIGGGTGFIVGDHLIATAAHCLYNKGTNTFVDFTQTSLIYVYNANGTQGSALTPVEAHIPVGYTQSIDPENEGENDYGLLVVEEDLYNNVHFSLSASYNTQLNSFSGIPLYLTGYAQYVNGIYNLNHILYTDQGNEVNNLYPSLSNNILRYNMDASQGQSGAPVYTITRVVSGNTTKYVYTALAIHHGGYTDSYNYGAVITKFQRQFYGDNPYQYYY